MFLLSILQLSYSIILFFLLSSFQLSFLLWLLSFIPALLPQAGAPASPDLSPRQQSPPPPPASPLSRSNFCSLLYSAPSGMAVASGKSSASSWMRPHPLTYPTTPSLTCDTANGLLLIFFFFFAHTAVYFHNHPSSPFFSLKFAPRAGQRADQRFTVFRWRVTASKYRP